MNALFAPPLRHFMLCCHCGDASPEEKVTWAQVQAEDVALEHKPCESSQKPPGNGEAARGVSPALNRLMKQGVSAPKSRSILPVSPHPSASGPGDTQGKDQVSHISIHRSLLGTSSAPSASQ